MLDVLPETSFLPFAVPRLGSPKVVWRNAEIGKDIDFEEYAFCAPHLHDTPSAYRQQCKVLRAERYGGRGVGSNGGGVRCGWDGRVQVKGTGRNGLLGRTSDFNHSNGGAHMEEAIREALWGEVCSVALPFGAVRMHGIISTGTSTYFQGAGTRDGMLPRALMLREPSLRPAHFMRAIDMDLCDESLAPRGFDARRTAAAIATFDVGLAAAFGTELPSRHDADFINHGLAEMARRFASQVAAAHVKRIPHGALNCSNIALDGRLLDFGTMTSISDYGRIIVIRKHPELWEAHTPFYSTFGNLIFYLRHYLPQNAGQGIVAAEELLDYFRTYHAERMALEYLKLTGVPEPELLACDRALCARLVRCMYTIVGRGNREPFQMPQMPERSGAFHLNTIMRTASLCGEANAMEAELEAALADVSLRREFIELFSELRQQYLARAAAPYAGLFVALNAFRLNTDCMELCRTRLEPAILDYLPELGSAGGKTVAEWIAPLLAKARMLYAEPGARGIDVTWFTGGHNVIVAPDSLSADGRQITAHELIDLLSSAYFSNVQKKQLSALCQ